MSACGMEIMMLPYFSDLLRILSESVESIDEKVFNQLIDETAETLQRGGKIIVSGLGKNVPICDKFVGTMLSLGLNANFLHTNSAVHGDIGMVKEGDLVIVLTKSGETTESIYLTRHLEAKKANIWLLTFTKESTLTRQIPKSLILDLEHEGDMWNIVPNNYTTMNLIVLQALAMSVAVRMNVSLEDFKSNHPGGHIGEELKDI